MQCLSLKHDVGVLITESRMHECKQWLWTYIWNVTASGIVYLISWPKLTTHQTCSSHQHICQDKSKFKWRNIKFIKWHWRFVRYSGVMNSTTTLSIDFQLNSNFPRDFNHFIQIIRIWPMNMKMKMGKKLYRSIYINRLIEQLNRNATVVKKN